MTTIYLPAAQTIDAISYSAPVVLDIDRITAASLVASGAALYATIGILGACGKVARYNHNDLMDGRRVSGRAGAGGTDTPATCTLQPTAVMSYILKPVTIDGLAYTAGQVVTTSAPTAADLLANGYGSSNPAHVAAGVAAGAKPVAHAAAVIKARG